MSAIKDLVRRTPLYELLQRRRLLNSLRQWDQSDQNMLEFYSSLIRPGDLCFDVGANIGKRTKIFLKLGARVVALEPQTACTRILKKMFGKDPQFKLVEEAVGESIGEAEMMISDASTISSLSPDWIKAVKTSGRFSDYSWDKKRVVSVTTLDRLIENHGLPTFIKIDVEGYEFPVLKGLSRPVRGLSLEFTPEMFDSISRCVEYLSSLGDVHLNYSPEESMQFAFTEWMRPREALGWLKQWKDDHSVYGDIYVRFDSFNRDLP